MRIVVSVQVYELESDGCEEDVLAKMESNFNIHVRNSWFTTLLNGPRLLQFFYNTVTSNLCTGYSAKICCSESIIQHLSYSSLDCFGWLFQAQRIPKK